MDHRRILGWASGLLARLETSSRDFLGTGQVYNISHELDAKPPEYVVSLREGPHEPFPDEWVFLIGDIVRNMRVALDYLACSIVLRADPSANESQIAFPICDTPTKYASVEGLRVGKAPPAAKAIIQHLQPYHGAHAPSLEPLALLDAIENAHKHRRLLSAGVAVSQLGFRMLQGSQSDVDFRDNGLQSAPLVDGAELARYTLKRADTRIQVYAQFHICFDPAGPGRGTVVVRTLRSIRDHILNDIFPQLDAFL